VSSVSSTDGLELFEQDHWSDDQKSKAGVVRDLVKLLLMDRDFDRFSAQFADHPYTQQMLGRLAAHYRASGMNEQDAAINAGLR